MKQSKLVLWIILLLPAAGCERDVNPSELILGKWQEVEQWNDHYYERIDKGEVIEFLSDGTCMYHDRGGGYKRNYRIDSEFLYFGSGTFPGGYAYRYAFSGSHKHRLIRMNLADGALELSMGTPTSHIYKQLK